ncbi:MAG: recombinase family protein [Gordonia sp. (in: high G+C Gram-positive bacteria)]|uniref:recombinase family protein n=1 Tax=Gordonia sp. (in: high G+C Gram-positive bacteria) TaxID=84139 RepID=UPI003C7362C9
MGTTPKPLVAREYLRVSRDSDGTGKSTSQQHDENLEAIDQQGWNAHPKPYRDDDRSASRYARKERENFARLISDLENGSFDADVLVIWESSRGSRRLGEWASLIDLCEDRDVKIYVTTHHRLYDPSLPRDRRSMGEDAVDAEYESAKTSERIQRSVTAAAKAGRVHGKNLYGYRRIYKQTPAGAKIDRIVEHPDQAPIVKEAARRVLEGETYYAIAKDLNERGIPARRPSYAKDGRRKHFGWTGGAVKQMLSMPAYAGKRIHNGEIVADAVWPALIPYDQWQKLQSTLFRPERRRNPNMWTVRYLCTGVAVCGVCGARLRVGKQNRGTIGPKIPKPGETSRAAIRQATKERKAALAARRAECVCAEGEDATGVQGADRCPYHYRTYTCSGLPGPDGKRGFHVAMKVDHLDQIVTALIIARLARPDVLALLGQPDGSADAERSELLAQIERDQQYLEDVKQQAADARDLTIYLDQQARIQPAIDEASRKLEQLVDTDPMVLNLAAAAGHSPNVEERESAVRELWDRLDLVDKRRVISAVAVPQVLPADRRGSRDPAKRLERIVPGWRS